MENKRKSNFELLRIICMIMIIFHHFAVHSAFNTQIVGINNFWILFIRMGGKIGVNIFFLISAYFLINKEDVKIGKHIGKLWLEIAFYSIFIYIGFYVMFLKNQFGFKEFIKNCMPIVNSKYPFATAYFLLYIFYPFINKMLNNLTQEEHKKLIIILFIISTIVPLFVEFSNYINFLGFTIFLYTIGAYMRKYESTKKNNIPQLSIVAVGIIILTYILFCLCNYSYEKSKILYSYTDKIYQVDSPLILIISILLFKIFKSIDIAVFNKIINTISATTFGVFLIHDNMYIRPYLWQVRLKSNMLIGSKYFIPYSIIICFGIFIICSIIDFIRIKLFKNKLSNYVTKRFFNN